jgi:hypothetical protein
MTFNKEATSFVGKILFDCLGVGQHVFRLDSRVVQISKFNPDIGSVELLSTVGTLRISK